MPAAYSTGTATGPGATDAFFQAIRTLLLANGWTAHDIIADTTGTRDIVFRSSALDATADNRGFVRMTQTSTTNLGFRCYADWDVATHVGVAEAGATASTNLTTQDASFTYFLRVNEFALAYCAKISTLYHKGSCGFVRRGLSTSKGGVTKTIQGYSAGVTTMNVASDMTTKLKVGQKVQIINYAHTSGSANAANAEVVTIQSVASGSITFTGATTKAYDSGALIGWNALPVYVTTFTSAETTPHSTGSTGMCIPYNLDGTRTSATAQNVLHSIVLFGDETHADPGDISGQYVPGVWETHASTAAKLDHFGWLYHWEGCSGGTQAKEDVMDDGDNTYIILGSSSAVAVMMGPR